MIVLLNSYTVTKFIFTHLKMVYCNDASKTAKTLKNVD